MREYGFELVAPGRGPVSIAMRGTSHRFLGGFLVAHELDAAVIKDGHPSASDVKIVASHWKPRRERRLANDVALMLGVLARRKWGSQGRCGVAREPPAMSALRRRMQINDPRLGAQPYPRGGELEGG